MSDLVTEDDLARARIDPAFRQQLLAASLNRLVAALNKARQTGDSSQDAARQIREGANLAVQLADRLQGLTGPSGPRAA